MPTRREVLAGAAALLAVAQASSCATHDALPEGAVRVPLAEVPDGTATTIMRVDEPVELRRTGSAVVARSLFCTHFGCRLSWVAGTERYQCPCHGGAFDAEGRPIAGPPTEPLHQLPATIRGEFVVVERRRR